MFLFLFLIALTTIYKEVLHCITLYYIFKLFDLQIKILSFINRIFQMIINSTNKSINIFKVLLCLNIHVFRIWIDYSILFLIYLRNASQNFSFWKKK